MNPMKMLGGSLLALSLAACGGEKADDKTAAPKAEKSANGVAGALADHKSFAKMLGEAGLATAIDGPGSYTVFAPSDAALAALPKGPVADATEERQRATALVLAHVSPGAIMLADLKKAVTGKEGKAVVRTMAGDTLTVTQKDGKLMIGRDDLPPVPLEATETGSGDDVVIGISGALVAN